MLKVMPFHPTDEEYKRVQRNVKKMNTIAKKYGYEIKLTPSGMSIGLIQHNYYGTGIIIDGGYDDEGFYSINRFTVSFAGFGSQDSFEKEENIFQGILAAKHCVNALNKYIFNDWT